MVRLNTKQDMNVAWIPRTTAKKYDWTTVVLNSGVSNELTLLWTRAFFPVIPGVAPTNGLF